MQLQHALQILLEMVLGRQTICWNFLFFWLVQLLVLVLLVIMVVG
jgi:hypothetical protein